MPGVDITLEEIAGAFREEPRSSISKCGRAHAGPSEAKHL